ncbi:MAG TPA: 5-methyltetrahydropteroyltriglutamate--homocysteine S-methyltransferase, partial [Bacillota bacterium]
MAKAINLGFPRIGARRELKRATEAYWQGALDRAALLETGAELRRRHWQLQREAGIDSIPSNDFSFYDQVLDMACLVGAVPERFAALAAQHPVDLAFAMARGVTGGGAGVPALEMTKWFDTNYHYLVPELEPGQRFELAGTKPVDEFLEARALGITTRPVLIGPVSFLLLAKPAGAPFDRLSLLDNLLPVYQQLLERLAAAGAEWVQLDEPFLALDLDAEQRAAFPRAYGALAEAVRGRGGAPAVKLMVATYFEGLRENLPTALALPVQALHLDLVRAPEQLDAALGHGVPERLVLSLGVVDGRNVWKTDLSAALAP